MIKKIGCIRPPIAAFVAGPGNTAVPIVTANDLGNATDRITAKLDEVIDALNSIEEKDKEPNEQRDLVRGQEELPKEMS